MIGLGFSATPAQPYPETDVGMLDVSANALAVLILATMLVLSVAAPPAPPGEVRRDNRPEVFYPSPLDVAVSPQSAYWAVTRGGVTQIDLDAFAVGLAEGSTVARSEQGQATLVIDRRNYRDLNDHRLHLSLDWAAIETTATPPDDAGAFGSVLNEIRLAFEEDGTAPTFFVRAEAAAEFAGLYWALRDIRVPIRWASLTDRTPLVLSRRNTNYERRARQWQR